MPYSCRKEAALLAKRFGFILTYSIPPTATSLRHWAFVLPPARDINAAVGLPGVGV